MDPNDELERLNDDVAAGDTEMSSVVVPGGPATADADDGWTSPPEGHTEPGIDLEDELRRKG